MKTNLSMVQEKDRVCELIEELERGEYKKDFLPNSSYEMSGEHQAMYFLHMRENMKTDIAYVIMHSGVDLRDVSFLREREQA